MFTQGQLTLDHQQMCRQNGLGIKKQPDKFYQITEEFIDEFHKVQDNHDLKKPDQLKTGKLHKFLWNKQDGLFRVYR